MLMERLCKYIYAKDRTDRIRTCAILCHPEQRALGKCSVPRPGSPVPSTPERREGLRACYWEGPSEYNIPLGTLGGEHMPPVS